MKTYITWQLPLKIANEANSSEHWTKKSKRHRLQKRRVKEAFIEHKPKIALPCNVILTRIAPRELDEHDNLRSSMKWIVDAVAAELIGNYVAGQADSDKRITWDYKQVRGVSKEYSIIIEFIFDN